MMQGVIRVPLAPIRAQADDRAELVTQSLFGELVEVHPVQGLPLWVKVRLNQDGYEGYMDVRMAELDPEAVHAFAQDCHLLTSPLTSFSWGDQTLHLPAGAKVPTAAWPNAKPVAPSSVMDAAMRFLGAPYLWGGKSVLGMDCSGLTQISGHLCGLTIPRDASQQWKSLQKLQKQHSQLETGDLVYFHKVGSTSISHVGLAWMDQGVSQVLHASGEVRVDDLGPEGIIRDGDLTHAWSGATAWPVISE